MTVGRRTIYHVGKHEWTFRSGRPSRSFLRLSPSPPHVMDGTVSNVLDHSHGDAILFGPFMTIPPQICFCTDFGA